MGVMIKHTLKSMWAHKVRTLLLIFCISICSLAAVGCIELSGSLEGALRTRALAALGSADMAVSSPYPLSDTDTLLSALPENDTLKVYTGSTVFTKHIAGSYDTLAQSAYSIYAVNIQNAKNMGLLDSSLNLTGTQAAVSKDAAQDLGLKAGDTLTLYDSKGAPADFTLSFVDSSERGLFSTGGAIVIDEENKDICGGIKLLYIDIKDDTKAGAAAEEVQKTLPLAKVNSAANNEQAENMINTLTNFFTVLFAVCLLLVIFVTVSASQRIITEKMPVIGTFRSLGISARLTYAALLGENVSYGLVGALTGTGIYSLIKPLLFASMGGAERGVSLGSVLAVCIFCILLELLCPIRQILAAVKTPIRDIIFANKDTEYKPDKGLTAAGIALLVLAAVTVFFRENFLAGLVCFLSIAVGGAMLFPYVQRAAAKLLAALFEKLNKPVLSLAAREVRAKKSTVGSAVLCFTAAAGCIVVYGFASSMGAFLAHPNSTADVIVTTDGVSPRERFLFITGAEGVSEYEYGYSRSDDIELNGSADTVPVYGFTEGGYKLFSGLANLPEKLDDNELAIGAPLAKKYGLAEGDSVSIKFKAEGFMPIELVLTVRSTALVDYENTVGRTLVISEKLYKELYGDIPSSIYLNCENADKMIETAKAYSGGAVSDIQTLARYTENVLNDSKSIMLVIKAVIALALGISFIGVVSSCLIGFEGRRRECAVLMSTALTKGQLKRMFYAESFMAAGIALIAAVPVALVMHRVFMGILSGLMITMPVVLSLPSCILLCVIMWAVFTLSAAFTVKALNKMNIAAQLKYE